MRNVAFVLLLATPAALAGPTVLTHSGRLVDVTGPLSGVHTLDFAMLNAQGVQVWSEQRPTIVEDGYYAATLGTVSPLDPARLGDGLTVVVTESGVELDRAPLRAVPVTLAVDGAVRLVDTASACTASRAGGIRYHGGTVEVCDGTGWSALASAATPRNSVVGYAYAHDTVARSLSGSIPWDDSVPQSSEGSQLLQVSLTPKASGNLLRFQGTVNWVEPSNTADYFTVALFESGSSAAIATASDGASNGNGRCTANGYAQVCTLPFQFVWPAPSTSPQTFTLRVGLNTGSVYINQTVGGRRLGGSLTSTLSVTEFSQ